MNLGLPAVDGRRMLLLVGRESAARELEPMLTIVAAQHANKHSRLELSRMDIADIAKRVRADIKTAIKAGALPAIKSTVRVSRYAGGQSLTITISGVPSDLQVENADRLAFMAEHPDFQAWNLPVNVREKYSPEFSAALATLRGIVAVYNWDESDHLTDHFDVNFYAHYRVELGN